MSEDGKIPDAPEQRTMTDIEVGVYVNHKMIEVLDSLADGMEVAAAKAPTKVDRWDAKRIATVCRTQARGLVALNHGMMKADRKSVVSVGVMKVPLVSVNGSKLPGSHQ